MDPEKGSNQKNNTSEPISVFDQSEMPTAAQSSPQSSQPQIPGQSNTSSDSNIPPQIPPSGKDSGNPKFFSNISPKAVIIAVAGLLVLAGIGFGLNAYFSKPKAPEQVALTYWGLWEDTDSIQDLINEYESHNPNVKVSYIKQAREDYRERLSNALKSGKGPDIFRFHNTWVPMFSSQFSFLPQDVMGQSVFKSTFYPVMARDLQSGDSFIGMPLMYDGLGLYINESLFSQAQKNPPTTWDDLRQTAVDLTVKDDDKRIQQAGIAMGRVDNVDHWEDILSLLMLQNRVDLKNPAGLQAEGALKFYTDFASENQNFVWDASMPKSTQAFASGKAAMYFGPSWEAFEIKQLNPNLAFRVVPVPQLPKNSNSDPDINWASYWVEGVWAKSKSQQEAWKFLKFLSEKSSQQKLYSNSSKARLFGSIYSRVDMAELISSDPFVGAYVKEAPTAQSWYLASRTFDGNDGINTQLSTVFATGINTILNERKTAKEVMPTVTERVTQALSSYK